MAVTLDWYVQILMANGKAEGEWEEKEEVTPYRRAINDLIQGFVMKGKVTTPEMPKVGELLNNDTEVVVSLGEPPDWKTAHQPVRVFKIWYTDPKNERPPIVDCSSKIVFVGDNEDDGQLPLEAARSLVARIVLKLMGLGFEIIKYKNTDPDRPKTYDPHADLIPTAKELEE